MKQVFPRIYQLGQTDPFCRVVFIPSIIPDFSSIWLNSDKIIKYDTISMAQHEKDVIYK